MNQKIEFQQKTLHYQERFEGGLKAPFIFYLID